jgi:galactokinase
MAVTFDDSKSIFSATSPGRMDVMGGIADYSGSLLLQMPIAETTTVSIQLRDDNAFNLHSIGKGHKDLEASIVYREDAATTPESAGAWLRTQPGGDWAAYVIGCFLILREQAGIQVTGADIEIRSNVPAGKGVSSSAALEVATMLAVMKAHGLQPDRIKLPLWAQQVENRVAGAACGLMDQLSVSLGEKKKLLPLVCQPHTVFEPVSIPPGIQFAGIDSGVRHAVGGASYGDVRTAAFMAYTIIAGAHGLGPADIENARSTRTWDSLPHGGYIANIPVSFFEQRYASLLPLYMKGSDFLARFGGTIDAATTVEPDKGYALSACARHPVYEQSRVNGFARLLRTYPKSKDKAEVLRAMGELMLQSHASYGAVGLGNERTDEIVAMVREAGPDKGVYGARISGGGSGGTVVVLAAGKKGKATVKEIYDGYKRKYRQRFYLFTGSSNGALF